MLLGQKEVIEKEDILDIILREINIISDFEIFVLKILIFIVLDIKGIDLFLVYFNLMWRKIYLGYFKKVLLKVSFIIKKNLNKKMIWKVDDKNIIKKS